MELPPRARRIHCANPPSRHQDGTTSACAENTCTTATPVPDPRNYLRVRGEYPHTCYMPTAFAELPPRARRILLGLGPILLLPGTTSACAENTTQRLCRLSAHRNYLRVRGEYPIHPVAKHIQKELPPRARRIPSVGGAVRGGEGTTSACAENTCRFFGYLR